MKTIMLAVMTVVSLLAPVAAFADVLLSIHQYVGEDSSQGGAEVLHRSIHADMKACKVVVGTYGRDLILKQGFALASTSPTRWTFTTPRSDSLDLTAVLTCQCRSTLRVYGSDVVAVCR